MIKTIFFEDNKVKYIDQTLLPGKYKVVSCTDVKKLEVAIKTLAIRGAPAIGIGGAYGIVLAALSYKGSNKDEFFKAIEEGEKIKNARPTAVNLTWAVRRMMDRFHSIKTDRFRKLKELILEAERIGRRMQILMKNGAIRASFNFKRGRGAYTAMLVHCDF